MLNIDEKKVVIFSPEKSNLNKQTNNLRNKQIKQIMNKNDIEFKKAIGSYRGNLENSYIVDVINFMKPIGGKLFKDLIFEEYQQDSVVVVDNDNTGKLVYPDNSQDKLGKLKRKSIVQCLNQDIKAFTIIGDKGAIVFE